MPVSIILSNQNIKLVSTRKNTLERWATETLPAGLVKDGRILDPQAVAAIMDGLFASLDLPRNEVSVSLTGLSFTYRILTLPRMKPGLQQEAIERATRKELRVPLEDLYLDWQVFGGTHNEVQVFVVGIPRPLVDSLVTTMNLARISLDHIDIKTLALARAVNRADALIVDLEPDWFDIAIISGGIPATLHSVAPKSNLASPEDNILQLKDELNRTIDFFNLTHKDRPVLSAAPLILAGSLAGDPALAALVPEKTGRPLQLPDSPLRMPAAFPLPLYMDNLGLVMKETDHHAVTPGRTAYLDIDIDPLRGRRRSLARPLPLRQVLAWAAAIIVIVLVAGLSLSRQQAAANNAGLQAESDRLNRSLRLGRMAIDEAAVVSTHIDNLNKEAQALQNERDSISGRGRLADLLVAATDSLPPGAFFSGIASTPQEITLEGEAARREDIIAYSAGLAASGHFHQVRIALIEKQQLPEGGSGEDYSFRIVILR